MNDQGKIIELLKEKKHLKVWEYVKSIGFREVKDINIRFIYFKKAVVKFDPYKNNNFILFYKTYLKYSELGKKSGFTFTNNQTIINSLMNYNVSPKLEIPVLVEELLEIEK